MTRVGCGEVVQFARTHGCNAKMVDLSHCQLDDVAATDELSRLVKNSGTWCGAHASPLCNRNAPFNPPASPFAPCPPPLPVPPPPPPARILSRNSRISVQPHRP